MRIDPPPSVPICSEPMPRTAATAAPPEDPPGVLRVSHGLRVTPVNGLSVIGFQPNSDIAVLPIKIAPFSRSRLNRWCVVRRRRGGSRSGAEPSRHAGDQDVVLDADRNALDQTLEAHPTSSAFRTRGHASTRLRHPHNSRHLRCRCTGRTRSRTARTTSTGESSFLPVAAEQFGRRQESDLSEAHTQQSSDELSVLERRLGLFQVRIVDVFHHPAVDVFDQIFRNFTLLGDRCQPNARRGHVDARLREVD